MMIKLKKEWNDVEKTSKELCRQFNIWRLSNLKITYGTGRTVEEIFGLPYTSSSSFAAIWNCQAEAVYKWSDEWKFEGLHIVIFKIVFCFDKDVVLDDVIRISDRLPDGIPAYYMFDKDNQLTGEKESPSDNKDRWEYLLENNVYPLTDRM